MQRKVIQQSATSLGISLPAKWAAKWQLKKGDAVAVEEKEGALRILPQSYTPPPRTATLDAHEYGKLTRRVFDNLSKRGYDEITVSYQEESELAPIKETLRAEATMFEIVKKERGRIVLKAISETSETAVLQDRLVFLLLEKANTAEEYLRTPSKQLLDDILELEKANNHVAHLCMRAINRQPPSDDACMRYTFIYMLEKLGNDFKFLAQHAPGKLSKETQEALRTALDNIRALCELYFKYDSTRAVALYEQRKQVVQRCLKRLADQKSASEHGAVHVALTMNEKTLYLLGLLFAAAHDAGAAPRAPTSPAA